MVPGQGYWIFMKEPGTYASVENVEFYIPDADAGDYTDNSTEVPA